MSFAGAHYRAAYEQALREHLRAPGEATLRAAYELGRAAVADDLSVLDLADAHNRVLVESLSQPGVEPVALATAAGDFFMESLSAYEMVRRGYREVREAAALERRQASTMRRLSTFLGDVSLASEGGATLAEVLQLIAEQARELVEAVGCIVAVRSREGSPLWTAASSPSQLIELLGDEREAQFLAVHALLAAERRPVRLGADTVSRHPLVTRRPGGPVGCWLGVPITALDGRHLGWIQLFDLQRGGPTDVDEALIVQLTEMSAATLERAELYER